MSITKKWPQQFECPIHGNMRVYPDQITTKKTCNLCGSSLIRNADIRDDSESPLKYKSTEVILENHSETFDIHRERERGNLMGDIVKGQSVCERSPVLVTKNKDDVTCDDCLAHIKRYF